MTNLGKLFAADAFIGNGDRLYQFNMGNILFKSDGSISAIDSAAILTNYNHILTIDDNVKAGFGIADSSEQWGNQIIVVQNHAGGANPTRQQEASFNNTSRAPALPPAFGMNVLFDVDSWWTHFKEHLISGLPQPPVIPNESVWAVAKMNFKTRVDAGLKEVDSRLSGFNWLKMKSKYKEFVAKFGGDPNLDWTNLKVRRLYLKLRRRGATDIEAIAGVQRYITRKLPA